MTCFWRCTKRLDAMTKFLTSWRSFWRQDILWHHYELFDDITIFLTSWNVFDFMTKLHLLMSWQSFDVMEFLMTWHTFWRPGAMFDVMTNFMTSWCVLRYDERVVVMTYFWRHDQLFVVLTFFFIISGTKYIIKTYLLL